MDEIFLTFKKFKALVENQTCKKIKYFRAKYGLKYCEGQFNGFCANEKIAKHRTVRKTLQQKKVVEQISMTLYVRAHYMPDSTGLPKIFQAKTSNLTYYWVNRFPSILIDLKTPIKAWSGTSTYDSGSKVFGCLVCAHVNNGKLEFWSQKSIFLGYADEVEGYKLWCIEPDLPKFVISRYVKFGEKFMFHQKEKKRVNWDI